MKQFTTEPKNSDERPTESFELDGATLTARKPKTYAYLGLVDANEGDGTAAAQGALAFMNDSLVAESREHLAKRLKDPDDDFDVEQLVEILNWIVDVFTEEERPTGRSSGSSGPRKRTGSPSTARSRSKALTPLASTSAASATS